MMATVLSNMDACFLETLYNAGWTTADANLWITAGLLPRIIRATMQWWLELHIHLQTISNANPEHWDQAVIPHLEYHSRNLAHIRKWSLTRTMLVLQNYTYLRDGRAKGYQDIKLLAALTTHLQQLTFNGNHANPRPRGLLPPGAVLIVIVTYMMVAGCVPHEGSQAESGPQDS